MTKYWPWLLPAVPLLVIPHWSAWLVAAVTAIAVIPLVKEHDGSDNDQP